MNTEFASFYVQLTLSLSYVALCYNFESDLHSNIMTADLIGQCTSGMSDIMATMPHVKNQRHFT